MESFRHASEIQSISDEVQECILGSAVVVVVDSLGQESPTFCAPGSGSMSFMEDNFSTDWGWGDGFGMIQAYYMYCALYF